MLHCDLSYIHWTFMFYSLVWLLNTLITQSISKGFRILGCSIFKMPFRYPFLSDNSFIIPHLFSFVKSFSKLFEIFFGSVFLSFRAVFLIIPHFLLFVKYFSELFSRIFSKFFRSRAVLISISHFVAFVKTFCDIFYCLFFYPLRKTPYSRLRSLLRFLSGFFEVLPSLTA